MATFGLAFEAMALPAPEQGRGSTEGCGEVETWKRKVCAGSGAVMGLL